MEFKKKFVVTMLLVCAALLAVYTFAAPAQAAQVGTRYVGSYVGTFLGDEDYGSFVLTINPDGNISGVGKSTKHNVDLMYSGVCQSDGTIQFMTTDRYLNFVGHIDWMNRMFGKWTRSGNSASGSFTAVPSVWAN